MWAVCLFVQTTLVSKLAESYSKSCWSRSWMWVMVLWDTPGSASQAKTEDPGAHMLLFLFEVLLVKNFHCWPNYQLQPFSHKADFMPNYCIVKSFNIFRTSEFHICKLCNMAVVSVVEQTLKSIEAELKPTTLECPSCPWKLWGLSGNQPWKSGNDFSRIGVNFWFLWEHLCTCECKIDCSTWG